MLQIGQRVRDSLGNGIEGEIVGFAFYEGEGGMTFGYVIEVDRAKSPLSSCLIIHHSNARVIPPQG